MEEFTHINQKGEAFMVDIHEKMDTHRIAKACGNIYAKKEVICAVKEQTAKKGDVLAVARVAGIMAAKKNSDLIPLCHNIALTKCEIDFFIDDEKNCITATCTACCVGKTGVEMEALTGVSIALLTVYDMCKAMDRAMYISNIHLLEKDGGKSGHYMAKEEKA